MNIPKKNSKNMHQLMIHLAGQGNTNSLADLFLLMSEHTVNIIHSEYDGIGKDISMHFLIEADIDVLKTMQHSVNEYAHKHQLACIIRRATSADKADNSTELQVDIAGMYGHRALPVIINFFQQANFDVIDCQVNQFEEKQSNAKMMKLFMLIQTSQNISIDITNEQLDDILNQYNLIGHIRNLTE